MDAETRSADTARWDHPRRRALEPGAEKLRLGTGERLLLVALAGALALACQQGAEPRASRPPAEPDDRGAEAEAARLMMSESLSAVTGDSDADLAGGLDRAESQVAGQGLEAEQELPVEHLEIPRPLDLPARLSELEDGSDLRGDPDLPAADSIFPPPPPKPRADVPKPRTEESPEPFPKQKIGREQARMRRLEELGSFRKKQDGAPILETPADPSGERRESLRALGYLTDDSPHLDPKREARSSDPEAFARAFLDRFRAVEGLELLEAVGYWANTYLPGDPALRRLQRRLARPDSPDRGLPHVLARRPASPADPPIRSALAVRLHADQTAVDGPRRVRLRVGLEGTQRRGGRRSAMRLAVVLHLGPPPLADRVEAGLGASLDPRTAARVRAYLLALGRAREVGDRFSLYVIGGGQQVVGRQPALDEEGFRHGPLVDLCERLFTDGRSGSPATSAAGATPEALSQTLERAIARVALDDDPTAPVGSSAVLLVAASPLGGGSDELLPAARAAALAGISLSTVDALGVDTAELERLTLAGHGRAYALGDGEPVERQVERELAAASRAVARAVRLNIRLADGVALVKIFGSHRLDATSTRHAKAAEKSLDRRLASSLGIASDRGEDDAGIQILIPAFYAGDSHALLLDLVVPGPGEVAEVTARYKDLIHLENGVARAHLELDRGGAPPGPAQVRVIEELLSHHLASELEAAASELEGGGLEAAVTRLEELRDLLLGLPAELPALQASLALDTDLRLVGAFLQGLGAGRPQPAGPGSWIASLRYASLLETQPRPAAGP
ncbi:MAG: hypothetical protein MI919_38155 [Holophagales bacterium]|nr:hypothetical protein [Holophagales bacterium]